MVAITTDTHHRPHRPAPGRTLPTPRRPVAAAGGTPALPGTVLHPVLVVAVAVALVVVVAVGTALLGRVLDAQRGIPVSGPAPVATDATS